MSTKKENLNEYIGNVNHVNKDIRNSLKRIIQQIEMSDYQCVAGYLRNNTAFVALKEMSELKPTNREGKVLIKVIKKEIQRIRDELYDSLPTGKIDAFNLIEIIKEHIEEIDVLIEDIN